MLVCLVFEKRGKLIALFRTFVASRKTTADRRRLKEAGILKERVFGCDLAEYLQNTGQEGTIWQFSNYLMID